MFVLYLNDMRRKCEDRTAVAFSSDGEKLAKWASGLETEIWVDKGWNDWFGDGHEYSKTYAKGSPLEWFNAPADYGDHIRWEGLEEDWIQIAVDRAKSQWESFRSAMVGLD